MEFAVQIPCLLQYKTQPRSVIFTLSAVPYAADDNYLLIILLCRQCDDSFVYRLKICRHRAVNQTV